MVDMPGLFENGQDTDHISTKYINMIANDFLKTPIFFVVAFAKKVVF